MGALFSEVGQKKGTDGDRLVANHSVLEPVRAISTTRPDFAARGGPPATAAFLTLVAVRTGTSPRLVFNYRRWWVRFQASASWFSLCSKAAQPSSEKAIPKPRAKYHVTSERVEESRRTAVAMKPRRSTSGMMVCFMIFAPFIRRIVEDSAPLI